MVSTHSSVLGLFDFESSGLDPLPLDFLALVAPAPKSTSGPQYTEKQVTRPCPTGHWSLTSMWDTSVSTAWYTGRSASPTLSMRILKTRLASDTVSTTMTSSMRPARLDGLSSSAVDVVVRVTSRSSTSSS